MANNNPVDDIQFQGSEISDQTLDLEAITIGGTDHIEVSRFDVLDGLVKVEFIGGTKLTDESQIIELTDQVELLLRDNSVVLDLSRLEHIASSALSSLEKLHDQVGQTDNQLYLSGVRNQPSELMELLSLDNKLNIYASTEEVCSDFADMHGIMPVLA